MAIYVVVFTGLHFFYLRMLVSFKSNFRLYTFTSSSGSLLSMHINDLPDLVLARIFGCVCSNSVSAWSSYYRFQRLSAKLVLLSVCRTWRQLAAPLVYRTSFVRCISNSNHIYNDTANMASCSTLRGDVDSVSALELDKQHTNNHVVFSNLDIITNIKDTPYPTGIEIIINTCDNPIYSFQNAIEKIRRHCHLLGRVRKLKLSVVSVFQANRWFNEHLIITKARSMGGELFLLLPSVQFIEWQGGGDVPVVLEFVKSMVNSYTYRLSGFILPQRALEMMEGISDKLKYVEIYGSLDYTSRLPRMPTDNITVLNLEYIGQSFDWSAFVSESDSECMAFNCLKSIQLRIDDDNYLTDDESSDLEHDVLSFEYRVIIPKLERLVIRVCPCTLLFLSSIQGLSTIKHVELEIISTIFSFTDFTLALARNTLAKYTQGNSDDYQTSYQYTLMNDLLNIPGLAKYSKAIIGFDYDVLDVDKVSWKYLSDIKFPSRLQAWDLKKLVSRHPNLKVN